MTDLLKNYRLIRENGAGFYTEKRGLIEVTGKEAVPFLNGLITNDAAKLEDKAVMKAAFPDVKGRLSAMVRVRREGDKFLLETEEVTHAKVFQNLFRFTFAGDFFVTDLSEKFGFFALRGNTMDKIRFPDETLVFETDAFIPDTKAENFRNDLQKTGFIEISAELREILRIENGEPLYGVDMDETTVVLETGIAEAVSFTKGCYLGQEIIARIHFRGHVAKELRGLILAEDVALAKNDELKSPEGKSAGRITSSVFSPHLEKRIALGYVRYEFLAENTELRVIHDGAEFSAKVVKLPFV